MKNKQHFASVAGNLFSCFFGLSRVCGSMNERKLGSSLALIHREGDGKAVLFGVS